MFFAVRLKSIIAAVLCVLLAGGAMALCVFPRHLGAFSENEEQPQEKNFIKWVDFNIPYEAMEKALGLDIASRDTDTPVCWLDVLAFLCTRYGNDFKKYKPADMDAFVKKLKDGMTVEELTDGMKYYPYYREACQAVLGGFVGNYRVETADKEGLEKRWEERYGLKAFSPIARGYEFGHYDDFGNKRSYGFARKHLGNDLMGSIGTPIIAVESGTVEAVGWNQYGGWRIGIRSFDQKRYYYYAHLRKDRPYHVDLREGQTVKAGDVIGYLGMTGYSTKENVNNINVPHLHFGMQLIFDESQKEGNNEIWIDVYQIVKLLQKNKSAVDRVDETKEYYRRYDFSEPALGGWE